MSKINTEWADKLVKQIEAVPDCKSLDKLIGEIKKIFEDQIASLQAQIAKLAKLAIPPTSLPKVIKYLKEVAGGFYQQYMDAIQTLAEVTAAYGKIIAAIESKKSNLVCNVDLVAKVAAGKTLNGLASKPLFTGPATVASLTAAFASVKGTVPPLSVVASQNGVTVDKLPEIANQKGGTIEFTKSVVADQTKSEVPVAPTVPPVDPLDPEITFTNPAPTVTELSSVLGPKEGGQSITITGTGFLADPTITIGPNLCTSVVVVSSTSITCVTPVGEPGLPADLSLINTDGQSYTLSYAYAFY